MRFVGLLLLLMCTSCAARVPAAKGADCHRTKVALQVLGSGGPIPDDARASSAYLVWVEGKARALIDVGGGAFVRFGESGAAIKQLDAVAVSHLHADHVGGLSALLKGGYFAQRKRPLQLIGPSGNERFLSLQGHVAALLDAERGAFKYLSGYLDGSLFKLDVTVVAAQSRTPRRVYTGERLSIDAVGVHHGVIPALGFVVAAGGKRIGFGGDQSADNEAFAKLARGVDALVVHHAIPQHHFDYVRHLHRTPSEIGQLAASVAPGRLVLSHHMQRALRRLPAGLKAIRAHFSGPIDVAEDLSCYPL